MARNTIESDFRPSKMAAGSHFVKHLKQLKFRIDMMKWERNAIERDFRSFKMAAGGHFAKKKNQPKMLTDCRHYSGGGGGGHHNGQPVNHSGIYTVFALGQIHQF